MAQEGISSSSEVPETTPSTIGDISPSDIKYVSYEGEEQLPLIMDIVDQELSEPYSIFTYRYFVHLWPHLCFLVTLEAEVTNKGALALYGNLGFIRVKRLFRYYLNGVDAFRLKLLFPRPDPMFMLNEENFNMDLSHQFSHEGSQNCNQHKDCSEHCDDFI